MAELRWYEWLDREAHPELKEAVLEALAQGVDAVRRIREERPRGGPLMGGSSLVGGSPPPPPPGPHGAGGDHIYPGRPHGDERAHDLQPLGGLAPALRYLPPAGRGRSPIGELHDATILWNGERYVARVNGVEVPARWAYGWYLAGDPVRAYPVRIALEAARLAGYRYHKTPLAWELSVLSREMGFVPSRTASPTPCWSWPSGRRRCGRP
ncbi:hypothetical protein [Thermus antranikianii]|uniref:hypothetical protein n=1 Tax=Thermus antranikianii TaxID=88190 RepID=UPI001C760D91|nr:hypothetical protein [Thermus antranikianii]QWK23102.1 MAG: hypothetical protein KNN15_06655 [Thermus antranikianii]